MSRNSVLSSEQALNDYFTDLLDESVIESDVEVEITEPESEPAQKMEEPSAEVFSEVVNLVPQLRKQLDEKVSVNPEPEDADAPYLQDIQRLLDKLESSDPLGDLSEVEALIAQNTANLAHFAPQSEVPSPVEEIQEWQIETASEPLENLGQDKAAVESVAETVSETIEDTTIEESVVAKVWQSTERSDAFQVLYFDVCGVMFAVPLDALGGIHRLEDTNHLIGRPNWYLGLQTNRDHQLDVVDTAKWVMPDKLPNNEYKETYQYIVMLGESSWGLACGELKGTELVRPEQVRWREVAGKRPWLAGMVKEKMCALIHVEELIVMLQSGLDVKALNK